VQPTARAVIERAKGDRLFCGEDAAPHRCGAGLALLGFEVVVSAAVQRVTLTPIEAAAALGVSRDFFDAHIRDELRLIRRGRLVLVPVRELERWADENAARVLA
jgi:excisionase family DNA binding protein